MNSRQKNFTLWSKIHDIVETTNKYNMSRQLKKDDDLIDFIMSETCHFPESHNLSFRAKAVAYEEPCECKECGSIVKTWGKSFCSHECYSVHKKKNPKPETLDEILVRVPNLMCFNPDDFPEGTATPDDEEQFVSVWNKIRGLDNEFLDSIGACTEHPSNSKNHMLTYLCRIVTKNKEVTDYFPHVIECVKFPNKTENLEWFTLLFGREYAEEKLNKKASRVLGDKNPAYQHGGKFSPFSDKFIGDAKKEEVIEKAKKSREDSNGYTTRLSYWTERYGEEEGKRLFYDRQNTFSKEKLIERYGEEEGIRRWKERQDKWMASLDALPENEKILINAKRGFWRYKREDEELDPNDPKNQVETKLYVIEYQPRGYDKSFIKVGVTSKYLTDRFPLMTIKEEIFIHHSNRFTNYKIERDVKKFIFEKGLSILIESEEEKFDGWTECVEIKNKDILMEVVNESIRKRQQEI